MREVNRDIYDSSVSLRKHKNGIGYPTESAQQLSFTNQSSSNVYLVEQPLRMAKLDHQNRSATQIKDYTSSSKNLAQEIKMPNFAMADSD